MKIKKISVKNFKAISEQEVNFNGCSAIITAGNNKGKTSLLRGMIDRFHSEKPDIIVKQGEESGSQSIELTDGSVIEWKFTQKSESFTLTTKDGIRQTAGVLSGIGERYFGKKFDIDKFLNASPKAQTKELQTLVGLDFTEIEQRYKAAYENRTLANAEVKRLRAMSLTKPDKVEKPDVEAIRLELEDARNKNIEIDRKESELNKMKDAYHEACEWLGNHDLIKFLDKKGIESHIKKTSDSIQDAIDVSTIEHKLQQANDQLRLYDSYERELKAYNQWIEDGKEAKAKADKIDANVKAIEAEKKEMIANANMPGEFDITDEGVMYNGLPLTNSQISSSTKYIAALKLGAMVLGEVKSLHFDASFLDKNSLSEIQEWAISNDLQLLIERPDYEGGEIKYEIIED